MLTLRHLMTAITAVAITANLQSTGYPQEKSEMTLSAFPQYSTWKFSPLEQFGTNSNYCTLVADGDRFLVRNNPVRRIGIFIDGKQAGFAVCGTPVSPIVIPMKTAARPPATATDNHRLIECDYYLIGSGKIDYIVVDETTNGDEPPSLKKG